MLIVAIFVFAGIFAPLLAPYDPVATKDLAEPMAMPQWVTIFPQYRDLPPTINERVDWQYSSTPFVSIEFVDNDVEMSKMLNTTTVQKWAINYSGGAPPNQEFDVFLAKNISYPHSPPQSFKCQFRWLVKDLEDVGYHVELVLVNWGNRTLDVTLWDSNVRKGHAQVDSKLLYTTPLGAPEMKYGFPSLVSIYSRSPTLFVERLGLPQDSNLAEIVFSEKGNYSLLMHIRFKPESENAKGEIDIINAEFTIPGLVFGILGLDSSGSDLFSQILYGSQISLAMGLCAAILTTIIGVAVGVSSGQAGGVVDELLMRVTDILLCLPVLPLLIILIAMLGHSIWYLILFFSIVGWTRLARVVRSQALSIKKMAYVESAKSVGASKSYIMLRHILPNVIPVAFASLIITVPGAVLAEAGLSFLGFGDPRAPTWGRMLNNAFRWGAFKAGWWWWIVPPAVAIMLLSLGFVFVGHAVDELVNPRLRRRR